MKTKEHRLGSQQCIENLFSKAGTTVMQFQFFFLVFSSLFDFGLIHSPQCIDL